MSKRARISRDPLTGGSGDVNPQTMILNDVKQSANDTTTLAGTGLPIPRLPIQKGRSLVMEILKVTFIKPLIGFVAGTSTWLSLVLTTNPNAADTDTIGNGVGIGFFRDPRTIAQWSVTNVSNAAPTSFQENDTVKEFDLTDEAGHGYLVATDNLYFGVSSLNTASQNYGVCKVLYRFKDVSLEEYIGIVQSQQ